MTDSVFCSVDRSRCMGDGRCAAVCPMKILTMKDGVPVAPDNAAARCVACGHCVAVCPSGALSLSSVKVEDCLPCEDVPRLDDRQMELFLRSRRSIRNYKDAPVEKEKLLRLTDLAHYAPTGGNSQMVGWVIADDREKVKRVAGLTAGFLRHLWSAGDVTARRYRLDLLADAWDAGFDGITRGAPALIFAHAPKEYGMAAVDCSIALSHMELAAPSLGLGACWAGFVMMGAAQWPPLREFLSVPKENTVYGGLMIGYPLYRYHRMPPRKPASVSYL